MNIDIEQINQLDSNGLRQGLWRQWYDHEHKKLYWEGVYIKGNSHGIRREWYFNGKLSWEESYLNGSLHGVWRHWHPSGQFSWEENFIEGFLEGEQVYYEY